MTPLKNRKMATALAALIAATPAALMAQETTTAEASAAGGSAQVGGQDIEEAIEQADAPDLAETDPVDEKAAAMDEMDPMSRAMILDVDSFTQEIYERGFRQGYVRGIADAREHVARQMQRAQQQRAEQQAQQQRAEQQRAEQQQAQQQRAEQQAQQQAEQPRQAQRTQPQGQGRSGTVIVLPPGVSPEAFLEELMRRNQ